MIHFGRPLVLALLAFLAGLLLALRFSLPFVPSGFLFLLAAAAALTPNWRSGEGLGSLGRVLPFPLFLAVGVLGGTARRLEVDLDCRSRLADGEEIRVSGWSAAAHRPPDRGGRVPLIPIHPAGPQECARELRVRMPPEHPPLPPGTHLELYGIWRLFPDPVRTSPWPRDPRFLGYLAIDSVRAPLPAAEPNLWLKLRANADRRLERLFPERIELIEALLLGRREYVDPALRDRYSRAGLAHLLAISGMHVGIIAGVLLLAAGIARLRRELGLLSTLLILWIYLFSIGAGASAIRAGIMLSLALLARLLQRPAAAAPIIAAAAFAILALEPLAILDPGFQLSFSGVLALLVLRPPLLALVPAAWLRRPSVRTLVDGLAVGLAAFLVTAPIVAHHFGIVAPISIASGIPAIPLMSLSLIGALAALLCEPLLPAIAITLAAAADLALRLLNAIAAGAAALPYGHASAPRPPWWALLLALALATAAHQLLRDRPRRLRRITIAGASLATLILWPIIPARSAGLEIHFLDVGQGDAIALRTPRNRWILIDAGPSSNGYDAGERRVLPFLRDRGARRLEALILTHPDLDHIGGAPAILRALPVTHLFEPGLPVGKQSYLHLLHAAQPDDGRWRAARTGRTLELDGVRMEFLWPDPQAVDASEDANQISAVLKVMYGSFTLLLTGDAEHEVEAILVERHPHELRAEILKLGHHGSATSSSEALLRAVQPELAIVSAGRRNRYGHPAPVVLARVERHGIEVARTDREGSISIRVAPGGASWAREEW